MGLGISVGLLCDQARNDPEGYAHHREGFDRLTRALAAEGITWSEPEVIHKAGDEHDYSAGFPYSYLSHMRRTFTLAELGEPVTPRAAISDEEYERDQAKVQDEMVMFSSHLLCHTDDEGYYIPVDFSDPLFLPEEAQVAGAGMVGSSHRLRAELAGFATSLGIRLDEQGMVSADEAAAIEAGTDEPFTAERYAWLHLYQACLASIGSGHAIVFC
ncbi:hypothetical protein ABIA31_005698 [Catenulispora sp. MAP5-51]|uniref:hypothetical protein n=1 Tax=Catenulispora sp. MAP5-51 TaxID=3156298 RepID=UPI003511E7AE